MIFLLDKGCELNLHIYLRLIYLRFKLAQSTLPNFPLGRYLRSPYRIN
jgi:hypothetical protein